MWRARLLLDVSTVAVLAVVVVEGFAMLGGRSWGWGVTFVVIGGIGVTLRLYLMRWRWRWRARTMRTMRTARLQTKG